MPTEPRESVERLNEAQLRHLLSGCEYADKLLSEIESILVSSSSKSPFPKYKIDISPAQAKVARDYIARIRAQTVRVLEGLGVKPPEPQIGAIHAIRTTLAFIDTAFEEARPRYMRGYGDVPKSVAPQLEGLVNELQGVVGKLNSYLAQGLGQDLQARLQRLEHTGDEIELLKKLEQIISERGLVEFRSSLSTILDRLETRTFEIALFGRVSSGKSSLLNHVVQEEVLPIGVNPVTSVPTRLVHGTTPRVTVQFAEGKAERCELNRLSEFVTEQHNPANAKHVTRIVVELRSPRLRDGVVFVDTPGLGSLATTGAAETLAYLPRCDLGVVLVDASSTLTGEDLGTVQALYEAAIPASVLLSKADLLSPEDQERSAKYIADQMANRLSLDLPVRPVSVKPGHAHLLGRWFDEEILPLYDRQQQLAQQSLRRQIGGLRDAVEAVLTVKLERSGWTPKEGVSGVKEVEMELRKVAGEFRKAREIADKLGYELRDAGDGALAKAASEVVEHWRRKDPVASPVKEVVASSLARVAADYTNLLFSALDSLTRDLAHALRHTAAALDVGDAVAEEELTSALKEMPRLDLGKLHLKLQPNLLASFSKGLAARLAEGKLRAEIGSAVSGAFQSYATLLEAWARKTIKDLETRFNADADTYRAQLERLAASATSSPEEGEAIRRDLQILQQQPQERPLVPRPPDEVLSHSFARNPFQAPHLR